MPVPSLTMIEKNFCSQIVENFTLKTWETMMCYNSFWMSWFVNFYPTYPWRCLVMLSSFVPRRYKIWVRLSLLVRPCNGIPWQARHLRHLITSSKYLCLSSLSNLIVNHFSNFIILHFITLHYNQVISWGGLMASKILLAVKTFWFTFSVLKIILIYALAPCFSGLPNCHAFLGNGSRSIIRILPK